MICIHRPVNTFPTHHCGISETPQHHSGAKWDLGGVTTYGCDMGKRSSFKSTCTHAIACLPVEQDTWNGAATSCQSMAGCHDRLQEVCNTQVPGASYPLSFHWTARSMLQHAEQLHELFLDKTAFFCCCDRRKIFAACVAQEWLVTFLDIVPYAEKHFGGVSTICIKNKELNSALS